MKTAIYFISLMVLSLYACSPEDDVNPMNYPSGQTFLSATGTANATSDGCISAFVGKCLRGDFNNFNPDNIIADSDWIDRYCSRIASNSCERRECTQRLMIIKGLSMPSPNNPCLVF